MSGRRPVMSALPSRAMPDDVARLYVLEATIEILKTGALMDVSQRDT